MIAATSGPAPYSSLASALQPGWPAAAPLADLLRGIHGQRHLALGHRVRRCRASALSVLARRLGPRRFRALGRLGQQRGDPRPLQ